MWATDLRQLRFGTDFDHRQQTQRALQMLLAQRSKGNALRADRFNTMALLVQPMTRDRKRLNELPCFIEPIGSKIGQTVEIIR